MFLINIFPLNIYRHIIIYNNIYIYVYINTYIYIYIYVYIYIYKHIYNVFIYISYMFMINGTVY